MNEATVGSPINVTRQQMTESAKAKSYSTVIPTHDWDCSTPEQKAAFQLAKDNIFPIELITAVPASIVQTVPDGSDKAGWKYGSCRMFTMIGGCDISLFENGTAPKDVNLSDIRYVVLYRQAVKNKNTGEIKRFAVTVPLSFSGEVDPGQTIEIGNGGIPMGTSHEGITRMATESFLKLQELCEEFYNREAA